MCAMGLIGLFQEPNWHQSIVLGGYTSQTILDALHLNFVLRIKFLFACDKQTSLLGVLVPGTCNTYQCKVTKGLKHFMFSIPNLHNFCYLLSVIAFLESRHSARLLFLLYTVNLVN